MTTPSSSQSNPIKLVYLIGTYPELTNTFIDREITTLRELGGFQVKIVSLRYPHTLGSCSPQQKALCQETLYLVPEKWADFNYLAFILANFYFVLFHPLLYFGTFFELLRRSKSHPKAWLMTLLYFWQGVYAAYLLRNTEFEHLHVHFMDRAVLAALVISRLLNKTYSFTAHAADIYTGAVFVREKINNAAFVITVSQYNKQHLLQQVPDLPPDKIHILHPWVDLSQFSPEADRFTHDRLHILSVGRLVEKKGHLDLIKAISLLSQNGIDVECQIAGEGPLRAELEQHIAQSALQKYVHLLGGVPQATVLGLLKDWADVFVLPCVIAPNGDRDGIPVSIAEAMAMELPVISTNIVGIGELVQPGTGLLVSPQDPAGLAESLKTLANLDQASRITMGRQGRQVIDREFNLQKGTETLAAYFRQTVRGESLTNLQTGSLPSRPAEPQTLSYVVISPVKDEAAYIETTLQSMINQTVLPTQWVIVNDGSQDATANIVQDYMKDHPWIKLINRQANPGRKRGKGVIEAFYAGYDALDFPYDCVVKLDGDVSFSSDYFESLLKQFAADPQLGIAGGGLYERPDGKTWRLYTIKDIVRGCTKVYRRACFEAIGGLVASMGWDGIDEWKARTLGWKVRSFLELTIYHYRFTGAATGFVKSYIEQGYGAYRMGYHPLFILARGIRRMADRPYLIGGAAMVGSYGLAWLRKQELLADPAVVRYVRQTQMKKLLRLFTGKSIHGD
jgi:glycosyltransferase involved in cell wall biosynthesis